MILIKNIYHCVQRIVFYYKQFFTRRIKFINNSLSKQLALTFDDGPHPVLTWQILTILKQYNINATFFLSGPAIIKEPDLVREIFNLGHKLGNHGYEHISIERLSSGKVISEFNKTDELIKKVTGETVFSFYRPPYGKATSSYLMWIKKNKKYSVQWSLDSYDYREEYSIGQLAEMLLRDVRNGDIILFHDTKRFAPDILKLVIPELMKRNFKFLGLDEKFK